MLVEDHPRMLDDALEVLLDALGYGFDRQSTDRSLRTKLVLFVVFFLVLIGIFVAIDQFA